MSSYQESKPAQEKCSFLVSLEMIALLKKYSNFPSSSSASLPSCPYFTGHFPNLSFLLPTPFPCPYPYFTNPFSPPGSFPNLAPTASILLLCLKHIYNQVWRAKHFNINISQVGSNQSECTRAGSGRAPAVPDLTLWFLGSRSRKWRDFGGGVGMTRQLEKTPETRQA